MCDEFHIQFVRGYHPDGVVVLPECMMKNDPACTFNFLMPPDAGIPEPIPPYENEDVLLDWNMETPEATFISGLRRKARITSGRVYFLREVMYEMFPERAEELFEKILDTWFLRRGEDLKKYLEEKGVEPTALNIMRYFDHAYLTIFDADIQEEENETVMEISYCPMAETWKWIDKDKDSTLNRQYCHKCYSKIFNTVNSDLSAKVESSIMDGDCKCRIVFKNGQSS